MKKLNSQKDIPGMNNGELTILVSIKLSSELLILHLSMEKYEWNMTELNFTYIHKICGIML